MTVAYKSITNLAYASRVNTTCNKPTVANGDFIAALFLNLNVTAQLAAVTPPSGFTLYTGVTLTTITDGNLSLRPRIYTRFIDGSEGASFTWTHVSSTSAVAILAFTGVDTTTPIGGCVQTNGTGTTTTYPTITPTAGAEDVAWGNDWADTVNNIVVPSGTPTLTERLDAVVQYVSTADNVSAVATSTRTQTNNSSAVSPWQGIQFYLNAAGAAAAPAAKRILIQRQALVRASYW